MAKRDRYGNALSTSSADAVDHYDRGVHLFLGAEFGAAEAFAAAAKADPNFALAHAGAARALMMAGRMAEAKSALATAERLSPQADAREKAHIGAVLRLFAGDAKGARTAVMAHIADHPRDAMVAQLCVSVFGLIGFSGETGREATLLAYTSALLPHYGEDWWMMSAHAISLCETGQTAASAALMERSLALNPKNANGAHFKSHALYETGETAAGRAYLNDWIAGYDKRSVLHSHLAWHLALWALHAGDAEAMWDAVDGGVGPGASLGLPLNILTDTAAILYRAELAGHEVAAERWSTLSAYAAQYFPNSGQSFADMHAALAHAMAGDGDRLAALAEGETGFAADLVRHAAGAWDAIARQDWRRALEELTPLLAGGERLGGSRAQRDLIELAYVNALLKLGLAEEARRSLATRRHVLAAAPPVLGLH